MLATVAALISTLRRAMALPCSAVRSMDADAPDWKTAWWLKAATDELSKGPLCLPPMPRLRPNGEERMPVAGCKGPVTRAPPRFHLPRRDRTTRVSEQAPRTCCG